MSECDHSFRAMGADVRLIVEGPGDGAASPEVAVAEARRLIEDYDARLSRFRADSELCALNSDPREAVPGSPLLLDAIRAGIWAAERSGGLVDPTLLGELEAAGYTHSRDGVAPASLATALALAERERAPRVRADFEYRALDGGIATSRANTTIGEISGFQPFGEGWRLGATIGAAYVDATGIQRASGVIDDFSGARQRFELYAQYDGADGLVVVGSLFAAPRTLGFGLRAEVPDVPDA